LEYCCYNYVCTEQYCIIWANPGPVVAIGNPQIFV